MLRLSVLALLVQAIFSLDLQCQEGQEISSRIIENPEEMVGKWLYIYHWDNLNKFHKNKETPADRVLRCPEINIEIVKPEFVKRIEDQCAKFPVPFKWEDAKLRLNAPVMNIKDSIIFMGEKENWLLVDCKKMVRLVAKKVSDDIIVMINPGEAHISEMLSRKPVQQRELECLAENVDCGKGMDGLELCY